MAGDFYNTVTKEISRLGFEYWKNAKGSHEKWKRLENGKILLVPRNLKSRHTANGILKDVGSAKKVCFRYFFNTNRLILSENQEKSVGLQRRFHSWRCLE